MYVASLCVALHQLPESGGVLDQDPVALLAIQELLQYQSDKAKDPKMK